MNKVSLPEWVHEKIEKLYAEGYPKLEIAKKAYVHRHGESGYSLYLWASQNQERFLTAIINGYTVEKPEHDRLRKHYNILLGMLNTASVTSKEEQEVRARIDELTLTLDILGITVEGVERI
ncbi:DUF1642 domain-containing protein [Priestia megaterium]